MDTPHGGQPAGGRGRHGACVGVLGLRYILERCVLSVVDRFCTLRVCPTDASLTPHTFGAGNVLDTFFNTGTEPKNQLLVTNVPKLSLLRTKQGAPTRRKLSSGRDVDTLVRRGRQHRMRMVQEAKEHHCVVNSTRGRVEHMRGSPVPVPHVGAPRPRPQAPRTADAVTWAFTPFVAAPGRVDTVSATLGNLTCSAKYEVMPVASALASTSPPPVYAVLAHQGSFHGFYREQFCGLYICTNASYCAEATLSGAASFASFALWGTFSTATTRFGLVSGDNGA